MKTRLDRSHELAYLKRYQGKKFKVKDEIELAGLVPNIYHLGSLDKSEQKITVDWWMTFNGVSTQHAVEYRLGEVLKYITLDNWIILK